MHGMILAAWLGCHRDEPSTSPTDPGVDPTDTATPGTSPWTSTTSTPTTPTTPPCEVDPDLAVTGIDVAPLRHGNEVAVTVSLSSPATAAVACRLRSDPSEVHLVEGTEAATEHALRFGGLLAGEAYDCVAAAVCPATSAPEAFEVRTERPPDGLPAVTVTVDEPGAGAEYVLTNASPDEGWDEAQWMVVFDRDGRVRWWDRAPGGVGPSIEFRYHGDDRFVWGGGWGPNALGRPRVLDLYAGEIYDSASALPDVQSSAFHHDGKQLPDGRLLTLEQVTVYGTAGPFDGFRVRRVDPASGLVDFEYDSQRAIDEGHLPSGTGDAWHANWVDIVDNVLYVSLCEARRVLAVDVPTGDWRWSFGVDGDLQVIGSLGQPLGDDAYPQCQHGIEYRGTDDHLLVYDNGVFRGYTRASEYRIDEAAGQAELVWTWSEPDWFETTLGDVDWLASGHVLVGACHAESFTSNRGDRTTILEVDPATGDKVWELQYDALHTMAYRSDAADPCALFANARYCDAVADRLAVLAPVLAP
ncbi:MAG: aryl-sulfate sulfotransferase [Myxococcota bacterium]